MIYGIRMLREWHGAQALRKAGRLEADVCSPDVASPTWVTLYAKEPSASSHPDVHSASWWQEVKLAVA